MEGYIGEVRLFAGNFAPRGWVFCDGHPYSIAEYTATFSILGTTYGGDGQTTFMVPDLRSRVAVGTGTGLGLSQVILGETGGAESVTMTAAQMPAHNHLATGNVNLPAYSEAGDVGSAQDSILAGLAGAYSTSPADTNLASSVITGAVGVSGGSQPFSIIQPVLATNYIICMEGIYPSRN